MSPTPTSPSRSETLLRTAFNDHRQGDATTTCGRTERTNLCHFRFRMAISVAVDSTILCPDRLRLRPDKRDERRHYIQSRSHERIDDAITKTQLSTMPWFDWSHGNAVTTRQAYRCQEQCVNCDSARLCPNEVECPRPARRVERRTVVTNGARTGLRRVRWFGACRRPWCILA